MFSSASIEETFISIPFRTKKLIFSFDRKYDKMNTMKYYG